MSDDRRRIERNLTAVGQCSSRKRTFVSRKVAKEEASLAARKGVGGMRPFRCPECDQWHLGHKPVAVMRGDVGALEYYGPHGEAR